MFIWKETQFQFLDTLSLTPKNIKGWKCGIPNLKINIREGGQRSLGLVGAVIHS